ncbi:hypothetical protein Barb6_00243 [Bacteroidales bacterium Barb6]|nr:hypothetical protein Barb6_00243 [Bacteroidales bacterium Barb6]
MIVIIKIITGLFIGLVLPQLIVKKKKKNPYKKFVNISCVIVSILIILYATIDLIKILIYF